MGDGWIKLHRKLLENPIMINSGLLQLFVYCLLRANHKDKTIIWNNELLTVKEGSFITGRKQMAKDLKQKQSTIYKRLQVLDTLGYISLKSNNKFTLLSITKYKDYQLNNALKEQQSNNKVTTKEQQSNTNNNDKNEENDKKRTLSPKGDFIDTLISEFIKIYEDNKGITYKQIKGQDRKAMGGLLAHYKKSNNETSAETIEHFKNLFQHIITFDFKNEYLNQIDLPKLNSKFNQYGQALKLNKPDIRTISELTPAMRKYLFGD